MTTDALERQVSITLGAFGQKELTISAMPHDGEYVPAHAVATLLSSTVKLLKAIEKNITGKRPRAKWVVKNMGMGPTEHQMAEMWACDNVPTIDN